MAQQTAVRHKRGGLYFDEERTNVYKLYRATRVAPDSTIVMIGLSLG